MAKYDSNPNCLSEISKKIATLQYDLPHISNEGVKKRMELELVNLREELNALIMNGEEGVI